MTDALVALAAELRRDGGLLAGVTVDPAPDADRTRSEALVGLPRAATIGEPLALAVEATREAELLHHAPEAARVVQTDDRDLALLAGDRLYALGLSSLADEGWTDEVAILADVVALVARLHADQAWLIGPAVDGSTALGTGSVDAAVARTDALWSCAVAALGHGIDSSAAALLRSVRQGNVPILQDLASASGAPSRTT